MSRTDIRRQNAERAHQYKHRQHDYQLTLVLHEEYAHALHELALVHAPRADLPVRVGVARAAFRAEQRLLRVLLVELEGSPFLRLLYVLAEEVHLLLRRVREDREQYAPAGLPALRRQATGRQKLLHREIVKVREHMTLIGQFGERRLKPSRGGTGEGALQLVLGALQRYRT